MRIRRYVEPDLPKLIKLSNKIGPVWGRYEFIPYTQEKFLLEMHEGDAAVLVAEDDQVEGLVMLYRGVHGEEIRLLCARRGPTQKEIEDSLALEVEKEVRSERLFAVVDSESPRIRDFIRRGYEIYGGLYQMVAQLFRWRPIPPVPQGYTLRSLASNEEEALIKVVNTAFKGKRLQPGALERWKSEDPTFTEEWVHVAESNGEAVSVIVLRPDSKFNQHYGAKRGYLGPIATLPTHTRKGLANALTHRAMNFLHKKGMDAVSLNTTENNFAAVNLFKNLGFKITHYWKFLQKSFLKSP